MTDEKQSQSVESLGQYLKNQREEKNLSFQEALDETRIPPKSLEAMEADDYDSLPAETFARGFYMLYARFLGLNSEEVLERYDQERTDEQEEEKYILPSELEKKINHIATEQSMSFNTVTAIGLVIILAIIALLFFTFSSNTSKYIASNEQSVQENTTPASDEAASVPDSANNTAPLGQENTASAYFLSMDFLEDTTITIVIDGGLPVEESHGKGSTHSWYADESLSLLLPDSAQVNLFFDGSQVDLPKPVEGVITVDLP